MRRAWAGLRTFAPDRVPVLGEDPDAAGFWWLVGQGGAGIKTSPAMAALLTAQLTGADAGIDDAAALVPPALTAPVPLTAPPELLRFVSPQPANLADVGDTNRRVGPWDGSRRFSRGRASG